MNGFYHSNIDWMLHKITIMIIWNLLCQTFVSHIAVKKVINFDHQNKTIDQTFWFKHWSNTMKDQQNENKECLLK